LLARASLAAFDSVPNNGPSAVTVERPEAMDSLETVEAVILIEEIVDTEIPDWDTENFERA
jgi:acyl carrier protein